MSSILDCPVEIFVIVVEFLDVKTALQLRLLFPKMKVDMKDYAGFKGFRKRCLITLYEYRGKPLHRPKHWNSFYLMNDEQLFWLLDENITELRIMEAPYVTDRTLKHAGENCPNLESLAIDRGADDLRITCHEQLRKLTTEGVLGVIKGCNKLRILALSWCRVNGNAVCKAINANESIKKNLVLLNLNGVSLGDEGIRYIGNFSKLKILDNRDCCATDISPLAACPLEILHLCRGRSVESKSIVKAVEGFHETIKELCVAGNSELEPKDAKKILRLCPNLETFNCVRGCRKVDRSYMYYFCKEVLKRKICLDDPCCRDHYDVLV